MITFANVIPMKIKVIWLTFYYCFLSLSTLEYIVLDL